MEGIIIFAIALMCMGILLLLHHGIKHGRDYSDSNAKKESCACVCYFQPKDITHFETWIIICLTNAISIALEMTNHSTIPIEAVVSAIVLVCVGLLLLLIYTCLELHHTHLFANVIHNISNHETWILVCFTNSINVILFNQHCPASS